MTATKKKTEPLERWTIAELQQIAIALNLLTTLRTALGTDTEDARAAHVSAMSKLVSHMNEQRDLVRDAAGNVVAKITREGGES